MTQRMVEVVLPPTSDQTESGEAIALALQDELAAADGVDAGVPAPPAAGLGGHGGGEGDGSGPPAPTAPPLEQARALWQQPPSAGNAAKNQLDEVARYDEQLAWSIHERELRELSQADRGAPVGQPLREQCLPGLCPALSCLSSSLIQAIDGPAHLPAWPYWPVHLVPCFQPPPCRPPHPAAQPSARFAARTHTVGHPGGACRRFLHATRSTGQRQHSSRHRGTNQ
jgi:hypothetical protein